MNTSTSQYHISNKRGLPINFDLRFPESTKPAPAIIIMHGFKGYKDWGFLPYIAEKLAEAGAITVNMNFSTSGIIDPVNRKYNVELFASMTITELLSDAKLVIQSLPNYLSDESWNGEIYLLGHSLGAAIAVLVASEIKGISKIAMWGSISTFQRYSERQKADWREKGALQFVDMKIGQQMKININYLEDIEKNFHNFVIIDSIKNVNASILILHGAQDKTATLREARALAASAGEKVELRIIENTGHAFGAEHPLQKPPPKAVEKVLIETGVFFGLEKWI
ncbi:MAG: Alpha/beta hydrolase family protein [Ignavibacteria bacterium]|nr:Alpha/beta hydrolase family protein [Ignavibacteria bacterium]